VGHHAVQEVIEILGYPKDCSCWVPCLLTGTEEHIMAGNCSPIHPTVRILPHQTTSCSGRWKITCASPLRDWRGSPGSRGKLVARSWNGLLPQRHL
jgi:hypothetical protein